MKRKIWYLIGLISIMGMSACGKAGTEPDAVVTEPDAVVTEPNVTAGEPDQTAPDYTERRLQALPGVPSGIIIPGAARIRRYMLRI